SMTDRMKTPRRCRSRNRRGRSPRDPSPTARRAPFGRSWSRPISPDAAEAFRVAVELAKATVASVAADLAARDAFTAAVDAAGAAAYADEFIKGTAQDDQALLRLELGRYPEAGRSTPGLRGRSGSCRLRSLDPSLPRHS